MSRLPNMYDWLRRGLPITLLIDLLNPAGPDSDAIMANERTEVSWVAAAS